MGKLLDKEKLENTDKRKIGVCLELVFLFSRFEDDFKHLKNFISENSDMLNNQNEYILNKNFDDIQCIIDNYVDIILSDIDKNEEFCQFHSKYY